MFFNSRLPHSRVSLERLQVQSPETSMRERSVPGETLTLDLKQYWHKTQNMLIQGPCLHMIECTWFDMVQIEDDKKPGDDEDAQKLREAAGPTDIPRLYVPGRLLYLSRNPGYFARIPTRPWYLPSFPSACPSTRNVTRECAKYEASAYL